MSDIKYKYKEDKILEELHEYVKSTYGEHYVDEKTNIECFDAWIALNENSNTFRDNALKYLWRYGKKDGSNKKDLLKAIYYIMMCIYIDNYKGKK